MIAHLFQHGASMEFLFYLGPLCNFTALTYVCIFCAGLFGILLPFFVVLSCTVVCSFFFPF